jgi:hypothetical protein
VRVQGEGGAVAVEVPALADKAPSNHGTQRTVGLVVGGVGLTGMVAMGVVGLLAKSKYDGAAPHCAGSFCDPRGIEIRNAARAQGTAATVGMIVSGAALVTGAALWLTAFSSDRAGPKQGSGGVQVGVVPGGISVRGAW